MSSDWCNAVHVTMTKILIVPRRRGREGHNIHQSIPSTRNPQNLILLTPYLPPLTILILHCTAASHTCTACPPSRYPTHYIRSCPPKLGHQGTRALQVSTEPTKTIAMPPPRTRSTPLAMVQRGPTHMKLSESVSMGLSYSRIFI